RDGEAQSDRRILLRNHTERRDPRPAADPREDRHVLPAVRPEIGDRLTDDAGVRPELPEDLAGDRVDGPEPAIHRTIEDEVGRRRHRAAPRGKPFADLPDDLLVDGIPGG